MFSLTLREQFLVMGVLLALVTGAAVKHWRDARRAAGEHTSPAAVNTTSTL